MAFTIETWIYAGRRATARSPGLGHVYIDESGAELFYKKGGVHPIGASFTVEADRHSKDGGVSAKIQSATFVEANAATPEQIAEWTVLDRAAYAADELRKAETRAKKDPDAWDNMTLTQLKEHYRKLPWTQQSALSAVVTRYLNN